jgi:hypothetical protein
MMTRFLLFGIGVFLFCSCEDAVPTVKDVVEIEGINAEIPDEDIFDYDTLKGMYSGDFGGSDIRIIISYVSKTNAVGYNIHRGLQRNLSGKVTRSGDSVTVALAEPGDHKFDGVFELLFIGENSEPKGSWKSNSGKLPEQNFSLKKMKIGKNEYMDTDTEITSSNLHNFFGDASDTLGDYSFQNDGLVIFSYYPGGYSYADEEEGSRAQQMKKIQGSWSMKGKLVTVAWEKNAVFPKSKMTYKIKQGEYEAQLDWPNNAIYMRMYP